MEKIITGYKATDSNMKCKDHQFELGVWYSVDGPLKLCKNGFHFCPQPSGVWSYYSDKGTRIFKCEAKEVMDVPFEPGTDYKLVARYIRLVEEVVIGGDSNTGDSNTGDSNTGWRNTGDINTGNSNTGNSNTGWRNTGNSNTGWRNTGNSNTGDSNTGDMNTGNMNTGNSNTGWGNTGIGNATDNCSGYFCDEPPRTTFFNLEVPDECIIDNDLVYDLSIKLMSDDDFDTTPFLVLPNATEERIKKLHLAHKMRRKNQK